MSDTSTDTNGGAPDLVEISIDGRALKVPKGQNLVDALLEAGEEICYFCYHRGLNVVAQCRQCLVGLGDTYKLIPACQLNASDGMKIRSDTEQVREARRAQLEFTLVNHPIDCVICDKAGECALQRHYVDFDAKPSDVNHTKVKKPKRVDLGPEIVLDAERCIICSRCERFCKEIARQPQLCFIKRGDHSELTVAPGQRLDNPYSLNTVDICPVGALTDKDFRFKSRVWDLYATRSVCNGCAAGCEMEIHHKDNAIYRLVPPKLWDMNLNWMCDYGRRTYKPVGADSRLAYPLVGGDPVPLADAVARAAAGLRPLLDGDRETIGVVLGADASNEDNFTAATLAREFLEATLYLSDLPDSGEGDDILRRDDPNPNRAGAAACGGAGLRSRQQLEQDLRDDKLRALYVIGDTLTLPEDLLSGLSGLGIVIVQACHRSPLTDKATVVLPAAIWAEVDGTITDHEKRVKRMRRAVEPPGYARPHWDLLERVGAELGMARRFDRAFRVFAAMKARVELFADAEWGPALRTKQLRFAGRRG